MGIDILGIDLMGVDILGKYIVALSRMMDTKYVQNSMGV